MKSPSLESLYATLHKHLLMVESYTEIPNITFMFKACRLKPHHFFEKKNNKIVLYTWWFDEFGNSFKLLKNRKLQIIYGDLSIDKDKLVCTDLYYGLELKKIAKISKLAYISCGIDEDMYQECILLSMLGIDNYFRTYLYLYGYWQQVSTLLLGTKNLKIIAKNLDLNYYKALSNVENIRLPCKEAQTWLTSLPIKEDFFQILEKRCSIVSSIIKQC
jgi:hypothetical protein